MLRSANCGGTWARTERPFRRDSNTITAISASNVTASTARGCRIDAVGGSAASTLNGIGLRTGGLAKDNSISAVRDYGIHLTNPGAMEEGNSIKNSNQAGIWSYQDQCRIEGNLVSNTTQIAHYGIRVQGAGSLVIAKRFGPVISTNASCATGQITTRRPWADFQHRDPSGLRTRANR